MSDAKFSPLGHSFALASSPAPLELAEPKTSSRPERAWRVIVWDDPINLMSYVVYVFQRLFGFSKELATKKMLEVHHEGRSVVAETDREEAEMFVERLHGYGLQATLEGGAD